jgi:hypothetical protein
MDALLLLKLATMPLVIVTATLAGRRYGAAVAGLILGLPIVSGPISVFVAVEQGIDFAREAASGTLLGLIALATYCLSYGFAARRFSWPGALACGLAATASMVWLLAAIAVPEHVVIWVTAAAVAFAIRACPAPGPAIRRNPPPAWDLPARIAVSTAFMMTVTLFAAAIGPTMTGMASTFPVMLSVMAPFTHRVEGQAAVLSMLRGCIEGLVTFALFFQLLKLTLGQWPAPLAYGCALAATLVAAAGVLALQRRRQDGTGRVRPGFSQS